MLAASERGHYVVFLTDRLRLGAPIRMIPDPDLPRSRATTTRLRYAAQFSRASAALKFSRLWRNDEAYARWICTVGRLTEAECLPSPRPAPDRQPMLPFPEE